MGLLTMLIRGTREKLEENSLRHDLEQKLGHKVSEEEMYSLGSHLNAAPSGENSPLHYTQRESATPFADARPPGKYKKYVVLAGLLILIFGGFGLYAMSLSEYRYNRLNPFTPKPPENSFPAQIGGFTLKEAPDWMKKSEYDTTHFEGSYKLTASEDAKYIVWLYDSAAEAQTSFEKKKKVLNVGSKGSQIIDDTATRGAAASPDGYTSVIWLDGTQIKGVKAYNQQTAYDFEAAMRNTAPAAIVPVKADNMIAAPALLAEYAKNEKDANVKYKGKIITVSGAVDFVDKDKNGNPIAGFLKPGSTNMADGTILCTFGQSQAAIISAVKKGDSVKLSGLMEESILGNVFLKNCKKL